jgi:hypothetical protein
VKKLFKACVKNLIYVMAEDQKEAKEIARINITYEDGCSFYVGVEEVVPSPPYIDDSWKDAVPYGSDTYCSDNYKTCSEIIKEIIEKEELRKIREEIDKKQLKFEFYEGTLKYEQ